ncbi:hypothetical protein FISHEDRAFT_71967 [Fistulina hepatica ATCC 64428]|uniref:Polysaccharide lyase 14 domain-containing protein n=1 Tax=Fistulina hepatica ATCC 64428 TaxID=1128425 RepID=A0A0D7AGW6_9AGAR|nr:hypothetical protein FISHEDRAFT_71967 [Fistulina hepatica ATCC 64428]
MSRLISRHFSQAGLFLALVLCFKSCVVAGLQASAEALATTYSLTTSTTFPFPTATLNSSEAQSHIVANWALYDDRIEDGADNLAFVTNPISDSSSGNSTSDIVLQVKYPAGSYSHPTGGAQFYNIWNTSDGSKFESMLLYYEVAFPTGFDWVKGGKLPGLRGGPNANGCDGGNQPDGSDCFSTRLMWRRAGAGEVYAYILTPNDLCNEKSITCNSDYGVRQVRTKAQFNNNVLISRSSIDTGSFSFGAGQWNSVALLVQMNNPVDIANGNVELYYDDLQVISQQNLQFRANTSISANGLFFSTFFGGSDDSWATPNTTYAYFRNFQMWGGSTPSTLSGTKVKSSVIHRLSFSGDRMLSMLLSVLISLWI